MQHQYYLMVDAKEPPAPVTHQEFDFVWMIGSAILVGGIAWGLCQGTITAIKKQVDDLFKTTEELDKKIDSNKQSSTNEIAKAQADGATFIKDFINQKFETLNAVFGNLEIKREADKILFLEKLTALESRLSNKDETVNILRRDIESVKQDVQTARPVVDHMRQYFGSLDRRQNSKPGDY